MQIVDVKTYLVDVPPPHWGGRRWIFVKLITDDGIEGVGECTYHTQLNHVVVELIKDWGERSQVVSLRRRRSHLWGRHTTPRSRHTCTGGLLAVRRIFSWMSVVRTS